MQNNRPVGAYLLALVVMVAVASLTTSELWTRHARTHAEQEKIKQTLIAVAPVTDYDNNPSAEMQKHRYNGKTFIAYPFIKDNQSAGYVIQNETPAAYNGLLRLLVGVSSDGISSGVRIIQHRETPGLGDRIELRRSRWILGLKGLPINKTAWQLQSDGGQIANLTGATVSARATLNTAYEALLYFTQKLEHTSQYE